MQLFHNKELLVSYLNTVKTTSTSVGFVPTMGALHNGHLSLMKQSLQDNELTVVSIFVNPTQFNNPSDLEKYPRNLESDMDKISSLNADIIIYAPTVEDIFNNNAVSESFDFDGLENQMEGKFRPGHFNGVGTIVKRLFEIVSPTNAYFGEKDFQQLQIIRKLVEKNNIKVKIHACPIYREENHLAMSSRNELLSKEARKAASLIYETLIAARAKFATDDIDELIAWVTTVFKNHKEFTLEYIEISDEETLIPAREKKENTKYRAFIAVFIDNVRLIDTVSLN